MCAQILELVLFVVVIKKWLEGIGQGNLVSGSTCRDTSYLIFKWLESKNLRGRKRVERTREEQQRIIIVFVDDTDFYTNGQKSELKI